MAKKNKHEIRLAGSGGQGIVLASVILAEAAIQADKYTAQSQSYGPEARGGACRGETLISDRPIGFTKVQKPTFLMALTQRSLDSYGAQLPEDCVVLVDEHLTIPASLTANRVISLPILRVAREVVGNPQTANMVAVGCINRLLCIADTEQLRRAARMHIPPGKESINLRAIEEGEKLAAGLGPVA